MCRTSSWNTYNLKGDFFVAFILLFHLATGILGMPFCLAMGFCLFLLLHCDIFNINFDIRDGKSFTEKDCIVNVINNIILILVYGMSFAPKIILNWAFD
jgi:hypothetical protein